MLYNFVLIFLNKHPLILYFPQTMLNERLLLLLLPHFFPQLLQFIFIFALGLFQFPDLSHHLINMLVMVFIELYEAAYFILEFIALLWKWS